MGGCRPKQVRLAVWALAAWGLLAAVTPAEAAKSLKWKFKEGDKLNYALRQKGDMNINASGVELEIKTLQVMDLTWTVTAVGADGTADISQVVDRVQMKLSTPFTGDFAYDSKSSEVPEGQVWQMLGPFMEGMLGQEFKMKISPSGQVTDIQLPEKLKEALSAQSEGGGRGMMMGGGFSEEAIKELVSRAVISFPTDPVGDKAWEQIVETKMGPLGLQRTSIKYNLAGEGDVDGKKVDKISLETELTLEPPAEDAADDGADVEMEITEQEGTGEVLFDAEAGHTLKAESTQTMTMEGDFMGNEFIQERELVTVMVLGTSDQLPALPEEPAASEGDAADSDAAADSESEKKEEKEEEGDK